MRYGAQFQNIQIEINHSQAFQFSNTDSFKLLQPRFSGWPLVPMRTSQGKFLKIVEQLP